MKKLSLSMFIILFSFAAFSQRLPIVESPDKKIRVECGTDELGQIYYTVHYNDSLVLEPSRLGAVTGETDYTKGLRLHTVSPVLKARYNYTFTNGKRLKDSYLANRKYFHFRNAAGKRFDIEFLVSNDGVAFKYLYPVTKGKSVKIEREVTSFRFAENAKGWLQPMSKAKTGWEKVNPCYEEFYEKAIPVGTRPPLGAGWVFPALFQTGSTFVLITEAGVDESYCGSKLENRSGSAEYTIAFPDSLEVFPGGGLKPAGTRQSFSPIRIIAIGSLATIIESTLGTDLAPAPAKRDYSFAKPGKASWSWPILKDDSITYNVQKRFIDYAADMNWQYCLIDVNWDTKIGMDSIQALINYARSKNVGIWLWYNSAGSWNTAPYHPRNKLLTHEDRKREFAMLRKMGVAGIKIDFFGGDGQSMIKYYIDILEDAAKNKLMVNFHGATLPRGWHYTWPNLMTAEAVKGFEYVTFDQRNADEEPAHCTILPFTRNAFDPMDFTPMSLYRIPGILRRTTAAFELALSVLFLSGVQHFAETPEGMAHMPGYIKDFLRKLPVSWDDVKFIDGFPGKHVIIARKSGNNWYVAGINGEASEKEIIMDLSHFNASQGTIITEGEGPEYFSQKNISIPANGQLSLKMKAHGGFVIVL